MLDMARHLHTDRHAVRNGTPANYSNGECDDHDNADNYK